MSAPPEHAALAPLYEALPTIAGLDALLAKDEKRRAAVPVDGDRMAAPFALEWRDGFVETAKFEMYDPSTPLGAISAAVYRAFLKSPVSERTRCLEIGNVACQDFENAWLLDDPVDLLAREGLPPNLERLEIARVGGVTNAGDLGFHSTITLSPLAAKLEGLTVLELAGCGTLGKLSLPRLRSLRLYAEVTAKNLKELARANLPALEHLELSCDPYSQPEPRFEALRALLRSRRLPRLSSLEIDELDLDEDQREELAFDGEDDEPASDPGPFVDMIADSPLLRQLERLDVSFRDSDRELPRLAERAADFAHLATLEFWGGRGKTKLARPTPEVIRAAIGA